MCAQDTFRTERCERTLAPREPSSVYGCVTNVVLCVTGVAVQPAAPFELLTYSWSNFLDDDKHPELTLSFTCESKQRT